MQFDKTKPFGETAARNLAQKLHKPDDFFENDQKPGHLGAALEQAPSSGDVETAPARHSQRMQWLARASLIFTALLVSGCTASLVLLFL